MHVRGEAVPIRLGDGQYVFAVIDDQSPSRSPFRLLQASYADDLTDRAKSNQQRETEILNIKQLAKLHGERPVPSDQYPIIAAFDDLRNPNSIRAASAENVSIVLPGSRVASVSVRLTQDEVTWGISAILPWVGNYSGRFLDPSIMGSPLGIQFPPERLLTQDNFLRK
jgi:hypothetical protein